MLPFYVAGARSRLVSPGAGVAAVQNGAALLGTVPNGKVWIVEQAFASGTLGVAGGVDCQFLYTDSGPITFYAGPIERNFAASNKISARSDRLVVCGPGSKIFVTSNSAVAFTAFTWFPEIQGFEVSA
jgi:uncharacterized protein YigE (DUF2233 family)